MFAPSQQPALLTVAAITATILVVSGPALAQMGPPLAEGNTLIVDNTDPDCGMAGEPYCSIQAAIDAAAPGDRIRVEGGGEPYDGGIVIDVPDLEVNGEDDPRPVISGIGPNAPGFAAVLITANDVVFKDFEILNTVDGIVAESVTGVEIKDNSVSYCCHGITLIDCQGCEVDDNEVTDNKGIGIHLDADSAENSCDDNEVSMNTTGFSVEGYDNEFQDNEADENKCNGFVVAGHDNHFEDNTADENCPYQPGVGQSENGKAGGNGIEECGHGFWVKDTAVLNTFEENKARRNHDDGFQIDGHENTFVENKSSENGIREIVGEDEADGFEVRGNDNVLEDNRAEENVDDGFHALLSSQQTGGGGLQNLFQDNKASENGKNGFRVGSSLNTLDDNKAVENGSDGFFATSDSHANLFTDNASEENHGYGYADISTGDGTEGTDNTYEENECDDNDDGCSDPAGLAEEQSTPPPGPTEDELARVKTPRNPPGGGKGTPTQRQ